MAEEESSVHIQAPETQVQPEPEKHSWLRDMLYPLNHAISCLFTDSLIQPFVGAWIQQRVQSDKLPKWLNGIFESHDHHGPGHEHAHKPSFVQNVKHWFSGEVIGDLTAVPLTAAVHHYAPWVANGIRKVAEPTMGWYFRKGAERGARSWALEHNLDPLGPEAQTKQEELYNYEMNHLGDVMTWNTLSAATNVEVQKKMGSTANRKTLYAGKIFGTVVSNALLLGARATVPYRFQHREERVARGVNEAFGHHEHGTHVHEAENHGMSR